MTLAPYNSGHFLTKSEILGIDRHHLLCIIQTIVEMLNDSCLEPVDKQIARSPSKWSHDDWIKRLHKWIEQVSSLKMEQSSFDHRLDIVAEGDDVLIQKRKNILSEALPFLKVDDTFKPRRTAVLFATQVDKGIVMEAKKWTEQKLGRVESLIIVTPNIWPKILSLEARNTSGLRIIQQQHLITNITKSRHFMPYIRLSPEESQVVLGHYHCLPEQVNKLLPNEADCVYYDLQPGDHVLVFYIKSPTGFAYGLRRVMTGDEVNKKGRLEGKRKKKD